MFRKVTSLILTAMTLFLLGSPVLAASAAESTPSTVDEILNEYHERCDAVRKADATRSDSSTMSLTTTNQQLASIKADTIASLQAAGYEAYDVNPNTYATLEQTLNTDFSKMGLESDGSYLVVISGENNEASVSTASVQPRATTGSSFEYTYNNVTYTMRYVTVTGDDNSSYRKYNNANLVESIDTLQHVEDVINGVFYYALDQLNEEVPLGTIASFAGIKFADIDTSSHNITMTLNATGTWNRVFTQFYDNTNKYWKPGEAWIKLEYSFL